MKKKALSLALALIMSLGLCIVPAYADGGGGMIEGPNGETYLLNYGGKVWYLREGRNLNPEEVAALGVSWTQTEGDWHTLTLNGYEGEYLSLSLTTHLVLADGSVNKFERISLDCYNGCPGLNIEGNGELIATSELSLWQSSGPITLAENLQMTGGPNQGDSFPLTYDTTSRSETSRGSQIPKTSNGTEATYVRIAPATAGEQPEKPSEPTQKPTEVTTSNGAQVDNWAKERVNAAIEAGLVPDGLGNDYRVNITRAQFAAVAVKLYEVMGEKKAPAVSGGKSPFSDTDDPVVLQAAELGFVSGIGEGKFGPDSLVTREQMAVMLANVYTELGGKIPNVTVTAFADDKAISSWAKSAVDFMNGKKILSGKGDRKFVPSGEGGNAKIEEALLVSLKMLETLK